MPRYEHECRTCGLRWAEEYSVHDAPPGDCPECRSTDVYRTVGAPAFILQGSGWASDGYYRHQPLDDAWKGRIKLYDRKEDYIRESVGEAKELKKRELVAQNKVIKRTLGYNARITQDEADRKIAAAGEKAKKEV
jgi:putative FmdB family regulatory protein